MIIKKYVVDEMQEAVQRIKNELGSEAVIVSTKKIRGHGIKGFFKKKLEVTAVLDKKEEQSKNEANTLEERKMLFSVNDQSMDERALLSSTIHMKRFAYADSFLPKEKVARKYQQATSDDERSKGVDTDKAKDMDIREFKPLLEEKVIKSLEQQEKERLIKVLDHQLKKISHNSSDSKQTVQSEQGNTGFVNENFYKKWLRLLIENDVDQEIAAQLINGLETIIAKYGAKDEKEADGIVKAVLINRISQLLEPAYLDETQLQDRPQCMVFIGPPGVGKTTTLAKLSTRFKLLESKNIALITIYTYRYGAADQLKIYGSTIGVPVDVVMTPAELRQSIELHADKDYILIDTVGRSSKNTGQVLELKGFLESVIGSKQVYLVMSAGTKDRDLLRIIRDFQIANYTGYIFTKLDETETLGSMLNIVLRTGIPLKYCTNGQVVPDDIIEIKPHSLAAMIFRGVEQTL